MARILVVGADIECERALLRRLRQVSALPDGRVRSCRDLDDCDLLVIKDTPALRNAAANLLRGRPRLQCWVEDPRGRLRGKDSGDELDDGAIAAALQGMQPRPSKPAADQSELGRGSHAITQLLRQRLPGREGQLLLLRDGHAVVLLDIGQDHAIGMQDTCALDTLCEHFDALSVHAAAPAQWQALAAGRTRQPLRPLLWQWGLRSTHWHALDTRLQQGASVRMTRWPDFRVLGHDHDGFRLCSLLLKRAHTVGQCARLLDLSEASVRTFVHAAYLSGHAQLEGATVQSALPDGGPAEVGNLLSRMWRSLRGKA